MKYIFLLAFSAMVSVGTHAQSAFVISYPIGFTMGDHNDYISKTSFRGFNMEYVYRLKHNLGVGLELGWNVFYNREDEKEYKEGTASVTGTQFRYSNAVPILAQAKWLFESSNSNLVPYAGLGIGTLYIDRATDFGLYRWSKEAWQFCLRPEAGLIFKLNSTTGAFIGAKYYGAFNTADLDAQSYLTANIGFVFGGGW
jgi:opacity protein-like surface antigen